MTIISPLPTRRLSEKGSALFFVFVGIALFAALSYTVANMMRSGDPSQISEERAGLMAGEVLDYARLVREAVQDLRISNGCAAEDISFETTSLTGYVNGTNTRCQVFHANGGAVGYVPPNEEALDDGSAALRGEIYFPANLCVEDIGNGGAGCESDGADNEDLVMIVPYLKQSVCEQINDRLGLSAPAAETDNGWPSGGGKFQGSFTDGDILDQSGRQAGCFAGSGSNIPAAGTYHFYQVLMGR